MLATEHKPVSPAIPRWVGISLLLVVSATIRCGVMVISWEHLSQDPDAYRLIAENVRQHGSFSRSSSPPYRATAFRPPLYPLLLAAFAPRGQVAPLAVASLHLVLGGLTVLLVWVLANRWGLGSASYLAALLVACDPILLHQSTLVMTETLATFLAVLSLLALTRFDRKETWPLGVVAGIVLGLASLCRPSFLVWAALVMLYMVLRGRSWVAAKRTALLLGGFLLVLAPWVVRNWLVLGRPVVATTHGGYTLLLGNNPSFYDYLRKGDWGQVWDAGQLQRWLEQAPSGARNLEAPSNGEGQRRRHPELQADRKLYGLALQTIAQQPRLFAYATVVRVLRFWSPLPHRLSDDESAGRRGARWAVAGWYIVTFLFALLGLAGLGRRAALPPWAWGLLCVLVLTSLHAFYWSNIRMRGPVMPVVYLLAAFAGSRFCQWGNGWKWFRSNQLQVTDCR